MAATTWNPSDKGSGVTLSGANLIASGCTSANGVRSIFGASTGKWYWELTFGATCFAVVGVGNASAPVSGFFPTSTDGWGYGEAAFKYHNGSTAFGATYTNGDTVGIALDLNAGTISFYKNNVLQGGAAAFTGLTGTLYAMACGDTSPSTSGTITANFGATAFTYTPPAGYTAGFGAFYSVSGTVKDSTGAFVSRTVRAYRRSDGTLMGSATSDGTTGVFNIPTATNDEVHVITLDNATVGTIYNDLIDRVIPA